MAGDEAAMEEIKYPFPIHTMLVRFNFMHLLSVECWTRRNIPERPWTLEGGRRTHEALQTEWQFPVMVLLSRDNLPINWIGKGGGGGGGNVS